MEDGSRPLGWADRLRDAKALGEAVLAGLLILATGAGLIAYLGGSASTAMRNQLREWLAQSSEALSGSVDPALFASLAQARQEGGPAYDSLFRRIRAYRELHPVFRYAYTCRLRDGKVEFVVDGTPRGDADGDGVEDHAFLGQAYPDAPGSLKRVLREGGVRVDDEPYRDAWGMFQSGCAAIAGPGGTILGAACLDMDLHTWESRLHSIGRAKWSGFGLSVAFALGAFLFILDFRARERRTLSRLEELRADLERQNRALQESRRHLFDAKEKAEAATKAKSEFLAMMSHEIRTPMNGVLGTAHLLKDTGLTAEQSELMEILMESGEHLLTLISDILDLSKIEADRMELDRAPFDLKRLAASVCGILKGKAAARGVALETRFGIADGRLVLGDSGRVRQILFNLLGNAVKFTREGSIELAIAPDPSRPGWMILKVTDTGVGMDEAQVARLFQPFMQGDSSTSRRFGGTGLGLAITFRLVSLMGGTIGVESRPGSGSVFKAELPLPATFPPPEPPARGADPGGIRLEGLRALLVDDQAGSRQAVRHQLESLGLEIVEADSAPAARSALDRCAEAGKPPAIGVIDWRMPNEDGMDLCRAIRSSERDRGLPMLLVTYAEARGDRALAREAGFDAFLIKPIPIGNLAAALRMAIARGAGEGELITRSAAEEYAEAAVRAPVRPDGAGSPAAPSPDWTPSAPRVLLAEDNPVNQKVGMRMLQKLGCEVVVVSDGEAAARSRWESDFDLIIMDCMMPVMDGYDSTRAIRAAEGAGRRVAIVACTASVTREEMRKCREAGMDDFMGKPYRPAKLREMIEKWAPRRAPADPGSAVAEGRPPTGV